MGNSPCTFRACFLHLYEVTGLIKWTGQSSWTYRLDTHMLKPIPTSRSEGKIFPEVYSKGALKIVCLSSECQNSSFILGFLSWILVPQTVDKPCMLCYVTNFVNSNLLCKDHLQSINWERAGLEMGEINHYSSRKKALNLLKTSKGTKVYDSQVFLCNRQRFIYCPE